jgi:hypothetical protein
MLHPGGGGSDEAIMAEWSEASCTTVETARCRSARKTHQKKRANFRCDSLRDTSGDDTNCKLQYEI